MPGSLFRTAFSRPDVTPSDVLAFHRNAFGDARMSNDDPAPTDPPAPAPADPAPTQTESFTDPVTGEVFNFPEGKPTSEMTDAQRSEYWRHKARKHESTSKSRADYDAIKAERDQLKQATESEQEKAVREAREAGKAEAQTASANATVTAMLRMGLRARGIDDDSELEEIVSTVNLAAHADEKGVVDDSKVLRTINRLAGTANGGGAGPDTGQGNRGRGNTRPSSVAQVVADRQAARAAKSK